MRIISWNCNMAFRNKAQHLLKYDADIYVIQECEEVSKLNVVGLEAYPNRIWLGDDRNKGVCILAKSGINLEVHEAYNAAYRYVVPVKVSGVYNVTLFAVWAKDDKEIRGNRYIGQIWGALQEYEHLLGENAIIIGDWNSNTIWDSKYRKATSHSEVVLFLESLSILSLYHLQMNEKQGGESKHTLVFRKELNRTFHIDYCFLSKELVKETAAIEIPAFADWIAVSDHVPLIVDL